MRRSQRTRSTTNATQTTTPNVPSYMQQPVQSYYGQIQSLFGGPQPQTFGPTGNQARAFQGGANLTGNPNIGAANDATRSFLGYNAPQLAGMDLSAYMNPFQQNVIDAGLQDLERFRGMGINEGSAAATRSGAWGGSRHGVADSLTNEAALRNVGQFVANLRSQGFENAQGAAFQDIANRMGGDRMRLGAAEQLLQGGLGADANARANMMAQADLGGQERAIQQETDPTNARMIYLRNLYQLLGVDPSNFIGQTATGTETSNSRTTSSGSLLDGLGRAIQIGTMVFSDRRLKTDIAHDHTDASGLNWYRFRYLWDEPGTERVGVMADEAPPDAVVMHPSGYAMVDYAKLEAR